MGSVLSVKYFVELTSRIHLNAWNFSAKIRPILKKMPVFGTIIMSLTENGASNAILSHKNTILKVEMQ